MKRSTLTYILLACLGVVVACSRNEPTTQLRIGVLRHESSLPIYVADEKGLFKKHGLDVSLKELPPGDHMPALITGRVDIISPTSFPVLFGVQSENPSMLHAILPGAEVSDGPTVYGIVTRSDFAGKDITSLKNGSIMAINPFTAMNIKAILAAAAIPATDWPEVRIAQRDIALAAVADQTATAAIMDQPALAVALRSKGFSLLESNPRARYIGSPYWSGAGAVTQRYWRERSTEVAAVISALDEAILYIRANDLESHELLARRLELDPDVAKTLGGYYFPLSTENVPLAQIDKTVGAMVEAGILTHSVPTDSLFPKGLYGQ